MQCTETLLQRRVTSIVAQKPPWKPSTSGNTSGWRRLGCGTVSGRRISASTPYHGSQYGTLVTCSWSTFMFEDGKFICEALGPRTVILREPLRLRVARSSMRANAARTISLKGPVSISWGRGVAMPFLACCAYPDMIACGRSGHVDIAGQS